MADETRSEPRWHEALAYAVLGRRIDGLARRPVPDLDVLLTSLDEVYGGRNQLLTAVSTVRASSEGGWPVPLPPDLSEGLGAAQFWSALGVLRGLLVTQRSVVADHRRPLDADERRLVADAPPHHGS